MRFPKLKNDGMGKDKKMVTGLVMRISVYFILMVLLKQSLVISNYII